MRFAYLTPWIVVAVLVSGCTNQASNADVRYTKASTPEGYNTVLHKKADVQTVADQESQPEKVAHQSQKTADLKLVWKGRPTKGFNEKFAQFQPAYAGDAIFIADNSGNVQSFKLDGQLKWSTKTGHELSAGVGVANGVVAVATYHGDVIALDEFDGHVLWQKSVGSEILASPAVASSAVIIHSSDERIIALDSHNGHEIWAYDGSTPMLSLRGAHQPMIQDGYVVVGFSNGRAAVFQLETGRKVWEYSIALPQGRNELQRVVDVNGRMVIENSVLYATAYHGNLIAVQMKDSKPIWENKVSSLNGVSVGPGAVYVADDDGVVWAFDKLTGHQLWKQEVLTGKEPTTPTVMGATVAVGDNSGQMILLSAADGSVLATSQVDKNRILSAPLLVKDNFVVYTQGGTLAALAVK